MDYKMKEVNFFRYCAACKHINKGESEEPCDECLDQPVNEYSHKPIHFELAKGKEDPITAVKKRNCEC